MYSQSFSPKFLYACTTQAERRNSCLKKEDFIKAIGNELGNTIVEETYHFNIKQVGELYLNGRKKSEFN